MFVVHKLKLENGTACGVTPTQAEFVSPHWAAVTCGACAKLDVNSARWLDFVPSKQ